jgi:hypothetical protein
MRSAIARDHGGGLVRLTGRPASDPGGAAGGEVGTGFAVGLRGRSLPPG